MSSILSAVGIAHSENGCRDGTFGYLWLTTLSDSVVEEAHVQFVLQNLHAKLPKEAIFARQTITGRRRRLGHGRELPAIER